MEAMMNKVELMDNELDMVNGGFGWDDIVNIGKKVGNKVVDVVKKEVNDVVDTVVDGAKTTVDVIRNMDKPEQSPANQYFPMPVKPIII